MKTLLVIGALVVLAVMTAVAQPYRAALTPLPSFAEPGISPDAATISTNELRIADCGLRIY